MLPDVVYVVRPGDHNQHLRYSLRSLEHLPHGRVWIAGYCPSWAVGVGRIPVEQTGSKYRNSTANLRAALEHPDVSDRFVLFNDDFFVMEPVNELPVLHRGPIRCVEDYYVARRSGAYLRGMRETRGLLESIGYDEPLSYELHVPMLVDKAGMLAALDTGRHLDVLHKRSLYGNLAGLGGAETTDVKVMHRGPRFDRTLPFLSTMPDSFANGAVGQLIRKTFSRPSPYERLGGR